MPKTDLKICVPQLATKVGFRGAVTRQEVGGPVCLGVIVGIAVYENG